MSGDVNISKKELGDFIKRNVIPNGMSIKEAANLLSVSRSTLSNLLNGHTPLSGNMAARIERTFGFNAKELIEMQSTYDTDYVQNKGVGVTSIEKTYIPPFLQIKANDIEQWASTIKARNRLAVFLRTLVNSTGMGIEKIDFPGNDDAERPGWDGYVEAQEGIPWVPKGKSGWEFGVNNDPKSKADKDYTKSLGQSPAEERSEITFVFVTPNRWPGKTAWKNRRLAENEWKNVMVLDSSDLEQWLEQSVSAQAWLANEFSIPAQGVKSLDQCWSKWVADSNPELSEALFDEAIENAKANSLIENKLVTKEPLIIHSDSIEEALAFLSCLFSSNKSEYSSLRDQIVVFTQKEVLPKLAIKPSNFIAVITNREVEREFASYKKNLSSIIIYPKNSTNSDADIVLEPLSNAFFQKALEIMGYNGDEIDKLGRESGRSLTVLRRRLSNLEAIRIPEWTLDPNISPVLSSFLFAGTWNANNDADRVLLSLLTDNMEYHQIEEEFNKLLLLSDSPVWSIGFVRGVVSKIDTLYAINRRITWQSIQRFLELAEYILSEDDPALDLPEDQQWAANLYGKTRECSSVLRKSVAESLLLLAVHGDSLFEERYGHNMENEIGKVIKNVLTPLTLRKLEAQSSDLPVYAEAAPDVFLQIIVKDLFSDSSELIGLMKPINSGLFGRNLRTGLLWALESIAWSPQYLMEVTRVLAKLSQIKIEDNFTNKPIESLQSIFRFWMPQTTASLDSRIMVLEYLIKYYPDIAWAICIKQLNTRYMIGMYNYKPRWRTGAHGAGEPVQDGESRAFLLKILEIVISWKHHTISTLGDLVNCIEYIPKEDADRIWGLIENWSLSAGDEDKSVLREKIRVNAFSRRVKKNAGSAVTSDTHLHRVYAMLEPKDIIVRNEWLFKHQWVEDSYEELEDDLLDFKERSAKIEKMRQEALTEVFCKRGIKGVYELASRGECAFLIGQLMLSILNDKELLEFSKGMLELGAVGSSQLHQSILSGIMHKAVYKGEEDIIVKLIKGREDKANVELLLQAPFNNIVWKIIQGMNAYVAKEYWKNVSPTLLSRGDLKDYQYAVNQLLAVKRPLAAFTHVQYDLKRIPAKTLFMIIEAIISHDRNSSESLQLEQYYITEAFKLLTASGEFSVDQMVGLEFPFIRILTSNGAGIPNLEKYIESNPEFFVQALVLADMRFGDKNDPELHTRNTENEVQRAKTAYYLLENLSSIPGHDIQGQTDPTKIKNWVRKVRELSEELSCGDTCDSILGTLFSKSPCGEDGIWPCEPLRDVIEDIVTERFSIGMQRGLYNSRGVHWRGEGGDQERELSERYNKWAELLEFSYPKIAEIHRKMAKSYKWDAIEEDRSAKIRRRLFY